MQKIVIKLSKIWFWDPGSSEKTYSGSRILDPGPEVKKAPDPGSRIQIRNTARTYTQNGTVPRYLKY